MDKENNIHLTYFVDIDPSEKLDSLKMALSYLIPRIGKLSSLSSFGNILRQVAYLLPFAREGRTDDQNDLIDLVVWLVNASEDDAKSVAEAIIPLIKTPVSTIPYMREYQDLVSNIESLSLPEREEKLIIKTTALYLRKRHSPMDALTLTEEAITHTIFLLIEFYNKEKK